MLTMALRASSGDANNAAVSCSATSPASVPSSLATSASTVASSSSFAIAIRPAASDSLASSARSGSKRARNVFDSRTASSELFLSDQKSGSFMRASSSTRRASRAGASKMLLELAGALGERVQLVDDFVHGFHVSSLSRFASARPAPGDPRRPTPRSNLDQYRRPHRLCKSVFPWHFGGRYGRESRLPSGVLLKGAGARALRYRTAAQAVDRTRKAEQLRAEGPH